MSSRREGNARAVLGFVLAAALVLACADDVEDCAGSVFRKTEMTISVSPAEFLQKFHAYRAKSKSLRFISFEGEDSRENLEARLAGQGIGFWWGDVVFDADNKRGVAVAEATSELGCLMEGLKHISKWEGENIREDAPELDGSAEVYEAVYGGRDFSMESSLSLQITTSDSPACGAVEETRSTGNVEVEFGDRPYRILYSVETQSISSEAALEGESLAPVERLRVNGKDIVGSSFACALRFKAEISSRMIHKSNPHRL
jgi:hypothetical protein